MWQNVALMPPAIYQLRRKNVAMRPGKTIYCAKSDIGQCSQNPNRMSIIKTNIERVCTLGRMGNIVVNSIQSESESLFKNEKILSTTMDEIKIEISKARMGRITMNELLAFINSPAVIGQMTTEEAFLELLSTHLAYLNFEPGMIINCNILSSKYGTSNYAKSYKVEKVFSHSDSGFYSFLLVPCKSDGTSQHILITRGTVFTKSPNMKSSANGIPLNLDVDGIGYNFAIWEDFQNTMIQELKYYDAPFTLTGHSLGAILSARILELAYSKIPDLFDQSNVRMFNAPVLELNTVQHIKNKVISFRNDKDKLVMFPNPFHSTEFKTVSRIIPEIKSNPSTFLKTQLLYHKYSPFVIECLGGEQAEVKLINF